MDLSQLEIFLSIAEEKSFSRAAEKMFRTQPAISIAIKRLEEELGESLFDRSSKNGSLTEAGRILLSYSQRMINLREEARESVSELRGMQTSMDLRLCSEAPKTRRSIAGIGSSPGVKCRVPQPGRVGCRRHGPRESRGETKANGPRWRFDGPPFPL